MKDDNSKERKRVSRTGNAREYRRLIDSTKFTEVREQSRESKTPVGVTRWG